MKRIPRPVLVIALLAAIAFLWDRALRYYVHRTNPTIINELVEKGKTSSYLSAKLGHVEEVEENFELYHFSPDSIKFLLVFEGEKKSLWLRGKAIRENDKSDWIILKTDSTFK
jgi:hypothetical protein